jgi:hypothetical protein
MTLNKQTKNRAARMTRSLYNTGRKIIKAEERRQELVAIGKTLLKKEVPTGQETVITKFAEDGTKQETRTPEMKTVYVLPKSGPKNCRGREKEPTHFRLGYGQSTVLAFLRGKCHIQHGAQRKTRPGEKILHNEALPTNDIYNVLRPALDAAETPEAEQQVVRIAAYLGHTLGVKPKPERPVLPVIDPEKLPEIGEFADRDPQQGAAIDHSIATGEPLFAERITLGDSDAQATE